jgi:hypothetical protein
MWWWHKGTPHIKLFVPLIVEHKVEHQLFVKVKGFEHHSIYM